MLTLGDTRETTPVSMTTVNKKFFFSLKTSCQVYFVTFGLTFDLTLSLWSMIILTISIFLNKYKCLTIEHQVKVIVVNKSSAFSLQLIVSKFLKTQEKVPQNNQGWS